MALTRRDICILLPALMATATGHAAEDTTGNNGALKSAVYNLADLKVEKSKDRDYIPVFEGTTSNGQHMTLHESAVGPGGVIHEMYTHPGDEMFLVREGTLEVEMEGKRSQVGPGGIAYVASNTPYAVRNTSKDWTRYFVFLFGPSHPHIQYK
jgi:XRE family transcriptional regulator, regulator of sulfur utilization